MNENEFLMQHNPKHYAVLENYPNEGQEIKGVFTGWIDAMRFIKSANLDLPSIEVWTDGVCVGGMDEMEVEKALEAL